jgi:CheY-like chemotaxis protein
MDVDSHPHLPILIVDDDAEIREVVCYVLRKAGFEPFGASDGQEALTLLTQMPPPSLILLDLTMPIMNGYEFLRRLRKRRLLSRTPVVITSALNEVPDGAHVLLRKPYGISRLMEVVRQFCPASA